VNEPIHSASDHQRTSPLSVPLSSRPPRAPRDKSVQVTWLGQVRIVFSKDWEVELKSGEVLVTSSFFAALVVVLSSMAYFGGPRSGQVVAAGAIWLSVAFSAVLSLGKSWARERQGAALEGLLLTPLLPSALFAGKAFGLLVFLWGVEAVVVPLAILFFSIDISRVAFGLALISLMLTPGLAALGTLFGALTVKTRARDLALAIVLFPLMGPALLTAIAATRSLFSAPTQTELLPYVVLLAIFDAIFWAAGLSLFGALVED
jgi:heme exporter protein B